MRQNGVDLCKLAWFKRDADIKDGHITGLIFSKLARLARNTKELLEFAEIFRECDADLVSLAESIDTSTPAGRLFYTMIAAMAQWEREEISERVAASVPIRAQAGKSLGGQAPYGYEWKDKVLRIDPKEAPVRKLMFELFREHKRKKVVARLLGEQGYRTRSGSKFCSTTIDRLLRDPIAKGMRRANYTKNFTNGSKGAWVFKPESEWVHIEVEPIVSEELWNECNHYLTEQRKKLKRRTKPVVHLLSGLTYCHCGQKMYVLSNSPKYTCRKCLNKIPIDDLEAIFHHKVKGFLFSDQEIAVHLEQADKVLKEKVELLSVLETDARKLVTEIDKLYELYQSGMIDKTGFGTKYRPLAERRDQLDNQIPELQAEIDIHKISQLSQEIAIEEARDLHTRWPSLPKEEKRRIVETIVEKITVGDGEISISLYYTPPPPSTRKPGDSSANEGGTPPYTSSENRCKRGTNPQGFNAATS